MHRPGNELIMNQEDPNREGSPQVAASSSGSVEHPSWCPIDHSRVPSSPRRVLAVIAHEPGCEGVDPIVDYVVFDNAAPSDLSGAHVHLRIGEYLSVGYVGYCAEDAANLALLFTWITDAMVGYEGGGAGEAPSPEGLGPSPLAIVVEPPGS